MYKAKTGKLQEILEYSLSITEFTEADVFFEYQAHVGRVAIRVNEKGWESSREFDFEMNISLSSSRFEAQANIILAYLKDLYAKKQRS